ncbi:universal stress protein UspC [Shimwellia blattae]|uniref:Universal stress protein n=1 Tax=Shimwellia blattae (strain ATCC 29907 / DSM 4481 / JCM 1650 / NBRC 105725 / CDC 9005-74) TaxID=630626 RepID=I2B813_SHIBC|nr:universal stress protein UspC [Shimwellia blattae]AFJ46667.1 universal stress protein A [Shimwellia blattae DSM 4481 = NBRC 105725]GAB80246.1 universal stress protein C [Shimwellia blattae DSM 4481 = NBRC 105725]VDY64142.1 Universal stress protein A [Shimwellia blattae]VEC22271.1 Universal stress protein A [Shimwellia blattae]
MAYKRLLVAVAPGVESQQLVEKAVALARPVQGSITLLTLAVEPAFYQHMTSPMLEDLRDLLLEETHLFLDDLVAHCDYPITSRRIVTGELAPQLIAACEEENIDLLICGNHNSSRFSSAVCAARKVIATSQRDVLLICLR